MSALAQPSSSPGSLTTSMRALGPRPGPRVLRAAIVRRGEVLDERLLGQGEALTIGPTERSTFLVDHPGLTSSRVLIEPAGEGFTLHLRAGMSGQVALVQGVVDIGSLAPAEAGEAVTVPLDPSSRGKIRFGDAMLLFQIVEPVARATKPQLPLGVRTGLFESLDWKSTFIAAFSFLAHFGAVGAIYSDWTDPLVDDAYVIGQTLDAIRDLPKPAVEMRDDSPPDAKDDRSAVNDVSQKSTSPKATGPNGGKVGPSGPANGGEGKIGDAAATRISGELARMDGLMAIGLRGAGRGVDGVLEEGNLPLGLIDDRAQSREGVGPGNAFGLNTAPGPGGVVRPGLGKDHGLLGDTAVASNQNDAGKATVVKKPISNAIIGGPIPSGGAIPNANAVVSSARAGFRACYKREIDVNPTAHGSVRITVKVGPNGEVLSATPSGVSGLSGALVGCLVSRVSGLAFDPPQGGGATLVIPMGFEIQNQ
ncbi:MAG: AgmX/PglI C-terminal domain-containing protein [Byssovorax sp.]